MATADTSPVASAVTPSEIVQADWIIENRVVTYRASLQTKRECFAACVVPARAVGGRWVPGSDWWKRRKEVLREQIEYNDPFYRCRITVDFEADFPPDHDAVLFFVVSYRPPDVWLDKKLVTEQDRQLAVEAAFKHAEATPSALAGGVLEGP